VDNNATLARQAIVKAYVERKTGFLAWAKHHAPDDETAEDALQDAFIRAIANGNAFQVVEDAAAWIFSTLRNRLVDLWRGREARRRAGDVDLSPQRVQTLDPNVNSRHPRHTPIQIFDHHLPGLTRISEHIGLR